MSVAISGRGSSVRLALAIVLGLLRAAHTGVGVAGSQISDNVVRIGVIHDQPGAYADFDRLGSVVAARMAVEDAVSALIGKPVEVVFADFQEKADIGVAIRRQWFESGKVDLAISRDIWPTRWR
jgi:branched-chain amino acid transport system substrate-binding protein